MSKGTLTVRTSAFPVQSATGQATCDRRFLAAGAFRWVARCTRRFTSSRHSRCDSFSGLSGLPFLIPLIEVVITAYVALDRWHGGGPISEAVCRRQALIFWVTRRTRRRDRMEMKAISMKAVRCPRSKMVFNRR
jgi:hypothetical protein